MMATATPNRNELVRRGQRLEYFTIGYNSLEGLVSIIAGVIAGSVSLVGFGLDSVIEVASGAALLWRLHQDSSASRREQVERTTLRIVGWCFMALASSTVIRREAPETSIPGIVIAAAAPNRYTPSRTGKAPGRSRELTNSGRGNAWKPQPGSKEHKLAEKMAEKGWLSRQPFGAYMLRSSVNPSGVSDLSRH